MCGRGQVHTLEAIIASGIVLTSIYVALSIPTFNVGSAEFETLQLKKYADDLLTLLTIDNESGEGILHHYIRIGHVNEFEDYFTNLSKSLENNLSIASRIEIYDASNYKLIAAGDLPDKTNVVSSFRILIVEGRVYEVRLYVWFV